MIDVDHLLSADRTNKALAENRKLATALGIESEKLTVALDALHKILTLKPDFTSPEVMFFAMRDIAREGILGKV